MTLHAYVLYFQGGHYNSTVTAISGNIREVETLPSSKGLYGYGVGGRTLYGYGVGGRTAELLAYLVQQFGPVTSFSGSYKAENWTLNINRSAGKNRLTLSLYILCFFHHFQNALSMEAHVRFMSK